MFQVGLDGSKFGTTPLQGLGLGGAHGRLGTGLGGGGLGIGGTGTNTGVFNITGTATRENMPKPGGIGGLGEIGMSHRGGGIDIGSTGTNTGVFNITGTATRGNMPKPGGIGGLGGIGMSHRGGGIDIGGTGTNTGVFNITGTATRGNMFKTGGIGGLGNVLGTDLAGTGISLGQTGIRLRQTGTGLGGTGTGLGRGGGLGAGGMLHQTPQSQSGMFSGGLGGGGGIFQTPSSSSGFKLSGGIGLGGGGSSSVFGQSSSLEGGASIGSSMSTPLNAFEIGQSSNLGGGASIGSSMSTPLIGQTSTFGIGANTGGSLEMGLGGGMGIRLGDSGGAGAAANVAGTPTAFTAVNRTDTVLKEHIFIVVLHCITAMKEYEQKSLEELRYEDYKCGRKGRMNRFGVGTPTSFTAVKGTDTYMLREGTSFKISIILHCITAMDEYEQKSLEELRYEDCECGRKGKMGGVSALGRGMSQNSGLMGGTSKSEIFANSETSLYGLGTDLDNYRGDDLGGTSTGLMGTIGSLPRPLPGSTAVPHTQTISSTVSVTLAPSTSAFTPTMKTTPTQPDTSNPILKPQVTKCAMVTHSIDAITPTFNAPLSPPTPPSQLILTKDGYYTNPPLTELQQRIADGNSIVENFIVGRKNHGEILFIGKTDVQGLNLDELVIINPKEVSVYPDKRADSKPPVGSGLNKKAQVRLGGYWPICKTNRVPIKDPDRLAEMDYVGKLRKLTKKIGAHFIDYIPDNGICIFEVSHFFKYKLVADDSEDKSDESATKKEE